MWHGCARLGVGICRLHVLSGADATLVSSGSAARNFPCVLFAAKPHEHAAGGEWGNILCTFGVCSDMHMFASARVST